MNDQNTRENDVLAECIRQDPSGLLHRGEVRIMQLEKEERCLRRAIWIMAFLTTLAMVALGYSFILLDEVAPYYSRLINLGLSTVGLAAVLSLLAFAGVWLHFRRQITHCREEVRRLILKLLAERSRPTENQSPMHRASNPS